MARDDYVRDLYLRWLDTLPKARHIIVGHEGGRRVTRVLVPEKEAKMARNLAVVVDTDKRLSKRHRDHLWQVHLKNKQSNKEASLQARLSRIKQLEKQDGN